MNSSISNDEGVETRTKAYNLKDFLDDCSNHPEKIILSKGAIQKANESPLRLNGKTQILDFISQQNESDFNYVNTKEYRNGYEGQKPPVDSYKINLRTWDLYIAFFLIKTTNGWYIKSFHSDDSGETMSLGEMIFAKLLEKNK